MKVKAWVPIIGCFIIAAAVALYYPKSIDKNHNTSTPIVASETSYLPQKIVGVNIEPKEIVKIYDNGVLLGTVSSIDKINHFLDEIYTNNYEAQFPDKDIDIGSNVYYVTELSYYDYEDIDGVILDYFAEKNDFSIEATAIEFANDQGIYEVIYVEDIELYEEALDEYLSLFIDPNALATIRNNQDTGSLMTYGSLDKGISIIQTITSKSTYVTPGQIFTTKEEVLDFLKYGRGVEKEYYTVRKFDSVGGVGSKNHGLTAEQVRIINNDVIKSSSQVLEEGMVLCVTYFNSPIDVVVTKERMAKEEIYADDVVYVEDENIRRGEEYVKSKEIPGSQNSLYEETWVNGVLYQGNKISTVVTSQPVAAVIVKGTLEIPGLGTGTFRWPVDNPVILCGWGGYAGHRAIDIVNRYNPSGEIYASDTGTVYINGWQSINGYYMVINHNNGYYTYYGHMAAPGYYDEGENVEKGTVIGQLGRTGVASGNHTHFFIVTSGDIYGNGRLDPCQGFLACDGL